MKFKQLLLGSLFVGLMASCSDDLNYDEGKILENETTTYVRISLNGDLGTRAGETPTPEGGKEEEGFEYGTTDESKVKKILLTFFDAGRNYVGKTEVNVDKTQSVGDHNTIESFLTVVAKVQLPENINYPKYVVAYVNPTTASADLGTEKLEDAMKFIRTRESISTDGRTMNNSVYFNSESGYSRFATEVDFEKQFFDSQEAAENATDATIEITVERIEAKVRTSINGITINDVTTDVSADPDDATKTKSKYSLTFVPEAWFVNGTEKRSFLLKNYRSTGQNYVTHMPTTDFGYNLDAINNAFTGNGGRTEATFTVNDEKNKRSYWAIDPTYFFADVTGDVYPDVSYEVIYDGSGNTANSDWPNATGNWGIKYRSYKHAVDEYKAAKSNNYMQFDGAKKLHEYVLENTQSISTLKGTKAKASMTSVVVLGHYVITNNVTNEVVFDGETLNENSAFYVRHDADGKKYVMINDAEAIDYMLERSGSLFFVQERDKDGNVIPNSYVALRAGHLTENKAADSNVDYGVSRADFELKYPHPSVTNGKKQSEQWRTLRVKKNDVSNKYNDNIFVYDYKTNSYVALNSISSTLEEGQTVSEMDNLLSRMYSTFGVLERFQSGKAYFNVPLKHIWAANKTSNTFKADEVKLGDYGVVRNHIYDLTINSISGLGTGIGDINQPIVPPTENEQYYISTRLNILKWRVVKQSVDL